jgi:hypothetical protein
MIVGYLRSRLLQALLAGILLVGASLAQAEDSDADSGWQFAIAPYLWAADVGGKTQAGSSIDISFDDIVDNLESALMVSFEARKNKWMILADYLYLDVAASKQVGPLPITMNLRSKVVHLAGGYNLYQEKSRLDLIFGVRNLDLDLGLSTVIMGTPVSGSQSGNILDGIIGVKGQLGLSKRWYLPYYVDIGTGDSDFSWQATAGASFRAAKWVDLALVYRHLEWDLGKDKLAAELNLSGPAFGAIFRF